MLVARRFLFHGLTARLSGKMKEAFDLFTQESLDMLEYPAVLGMLAGYARTKPARERALGLKPIENPTELARRREQTASARKILTAMGPPPVYSLEGMEDLPQKMRIGESLSLADLRAVAAFLHHLRLLRRYAERAMPISALVAGWGMTVEPLEDVRAEIERCMRGDDLDDHASSELAALRRKKEKLTAQIKEKLASLLRSHPAWFQESFSSQRNGRYVLPVKREYRAQFKGSALDASASGATVFIEPASVRALHEELELCLIDEQNEIARVLAILTELVAQKAQPMSVSREAMVDMDYAFACAQLAAATRGCDPTPTARRELALKNARHPLLGAGVVPLSLALHQVRGLVITGPNTGGKTVALKTAGLLTLMALSGLQPPADEAVVPQFSGVYADIGDGQSIAQSLSTFSSHVRRIVRVLEAADGKSLVLLDELGSGTDPQEGMGLAVAVLEELARRGCLLIATSHYPELKAFASATPGFQNGRMTFNRATLSPEYRLEMGEAGESCALYIAKRLGLPEKLLERAWAAAYPGATPRREEHAPPEPAAPAPEPAAPAPAPEDMPMPEVTAEKPAPRGACFKLGDSVYVTAMKQRGIVCRERNARGEVGVRIQDRNYTVHEQRLRPFLSAEQLYPGEDYDLDIVLHSWAHRQAKRDVRKGKPGASVVLDEGKGTEP